MIVSGSRTPGVDAADFGLPPGTALRYERPAEALCVVVSSYAVFDSDPAVQSGPGTWVLPGWARLWIILAPKPPGVATRHRSYAALGSAMLFGVTSRAMPTSTYGGVSVAVDIGPLAWARLFAPSAELLRDRITSLHELLPQAWCDDLVARVAGSDRGPQIKGVLDDFFMERLPPPHPDEPLIARIAALLADEATHDLAAAAARAGIGERALLGLTKRYFGFPPKILSMRARFLRALVPMLLHGDGPAAAGPAGYHDSSHFTRDAKRFLGMTPRRFLAIPMPYTRAALRARRQVIGAATSSLDRCSAGQ